MNPPLQKIIVKEKTVGAHCYTSTGDRRQAVLERAQSIVPLHLNPNFFNAILGTNYYSLTTNLIGKLENR